MKVRIVTWVLIRPAPSPRPGLTPGGIIIFLALDGKFPGVGTLELSNPLGWGRKKRANAPSSVNTNLIVFDDQMIAASKDKLIENLFTRGSHHRNLSVIYIVQNLFHQGKGSRSISL